VTSRQRRVAELRAQGFTQDAAADLIGVGIRTLQRDEADPVVAAEIHRLQESGEIFRPEIVALRRALLAVNTDGQPDHFVRVNAARALLAAAPPTASGAPQGNGQSVVHLHIRRSASGEVEEIKQTPGLLDYEGALALGDDGPAPAEPPL
jgi:hypothetical protein